MPGFITPAVLILCGMPLGFRFTCYYYRGAYYKAFWADPPSCTVSEPRNNYRGEHSFPLIIQNIHRYFLYIAIIFLGILAYDVWKALWFDDGNGGTTFGIGIGTIILAGNVVLLGVIRSGATLYAIWSAGQSICSPKPQSVGGHITVSVV